MNLELKKVKEELFLMSLYLGVIFWSLVVPHHYHIVEEFL